MPKEATFRCLRCTNVFTVEIMELGEAEEKGIRAVPARCPKCGSEALERV